MDTSSYYSIGLITRPHGLKGEVTMQVDPNIPLDIETVKTIFVKQGDHLVPFFITEISQKGNKVYVQLEDVDTLEKAQEISKCSVFLPKADRPAQKEGGFYEDEIVGFKVTDSVFGDLGPISGIMQSGLQRLLEVDYKGKEVLIPINSPFIIEIDHQTRIMAVDLPEGFLDL